MDPDPAAFTRCVHGVDIAGPCDRCTLEGRAWREMRRRLEDEQREDSRRGNEGCLPVVLVLLALVCVLGVLALGLADDVARWLEP